MKSSLEYFIDQIWPFIPDSGRLGLTHKFERFREKASVPLPNPETLVFYNFDETKNRFPLAEVLKPGALSYSLVCTCKDEIEGLQTFIDSVENQSLLPKEVLICDAGSTDGTFERLEKWGREETRFVVKLIREEGAKISRGRNLAANLSTTEYLLFADLGTKLDQSWASNLCAGFLTQEEIGFVMGFYKPIHSTWWHEPLAFFLLPRWDLIDPQTFFASARSLGVTKRLYDEVGGFPENLSHAGEDSLFNFFVKQKAKRVAFVPEAVCYWQMERDPLKMWKSIYRYAKGDAETGFLFWGYYRELLIKLSKLVFDIGVFGILFILGWYLQFGFLSDILRMFSYVFLVMGGYRVCRLAIEYGVFLKGGVGEMVQRFFVLWYFLSAQVLGFLGGVFYRKGKTRGAKEGDFAISSLSS